MKQPLRHKGDAVNLPEKLHIPFRYDNNAMVIEEVINEIIDYLANLRDSTPDGSQKGDKL